MNTRTLVAGMIAFASVSTASLADNTTNWRWLAGSYWYVPHKNLPAYEYNAPANTLTAVSDQTVFQITGYANGYFWGKIATQIGDGAVSCKSLIGSVTPAGDVYLTFTPAPYTLGASVVIGLGRMVKKGRQWTMLNQMSSGLPALQIGHWAYMVQTAPGDSSWNSLPGVHVSVDDLLAGCPAPPTLTQ